MPTSYDLTGPLDSSTFQPVSPTLGDEVVFTTDAPASVFPTVQVNCSQDGHPVLAAERGLYPGGWEYGQPIQLGPTTLWTEGEASGQAVLWVFNKSGNKRVVAETILFTVS